MVIPNIIMVFYKINRGSDSIGFGEFFKKNMYFQKKNFFSNYYFFFNITSTIQKFVRIKNIYLVLIYIFIKIHIRPFLKKKIKKKIIY